VFQPWLGLGGAAALWGVQLPAWFAATQGSSRWDRPLAVAAGTAAGGAALHYAMWPWELRSGLPWLMEAEGLRDEHLPAYNGILWAWGAAAVAALLLETPRGSRKWALLGLTSVIPLRASARHHFDWVRKEARRNPAWWNRAFAAP
jgi:hypothetical protein